MTNKELEIRACKHFVCPNISIIDDKVKELYDNEDKIKMVTEKARQIATTHFKKTYHRPEYHGVTAIIAACVYIAGCFGSYHASQRRIGDVFNRSTPTIRKYVQHVAEKLDIELVL